MISNESKDDLLKKALIEIRKLKGELRKSESIAVIGIGCHFPGGITSPEEFWEALIEQRSMICDIKDSRWREYLLNDYSENQYMKKAGFLKEDIMSFDNRLFRLSPKEAERTDPQQRLFMKVTWEALENAGYSPNSLKNSKTGVYVGITATDYSNELCIDRKVNNELQSGDVIGSGFSFLSGRVSYFFGFQGPGITIDTACSSSLVAIDNACKGLITGECNMAIAGGVNLMYSSETTKSLGDLNILSPDCEIRPFDAKANGTVRGEGCGALVLKRLSDAEKDGDLIYAVIKGSGVNQDGPSSGLTAPYGLAQETLIKDILSRYEINSSEIGYVEAHGTGTELGDPIEISALGNVFSKNRKSNLYVGTVKANIGHLEAAAGVAGIIKVILAVKNGKIPGNLNFEAPSPHINWKEICIEIPKKTIEWKNETGKKRIAGVSCFGLSGTNAHAIVEEYSSKPMERKSELIDKERYKYWPFKFSSNNKEGLINQLEVFLEYLNKAKIQEEVLISDLSYSQNISKADLKEKIIIWADSYNELKKNISSALNNQINSNIKYGNSEKKVTLLFTGQGSQYPEMFKEFYDTNSIFKYYLDKCNTFYKEYTGNELLPIIFSSDNLINETKYTQPALFSIEYSLAKMWIEYGIEPALMIGHSIGEYVAACLADVFKLSDAIKLVTARGSLMQKLSVKGKMAAIFMKRNDVEKLLRFKENVSIAATNSKEQTIISGNDKEIDEICNDLKKKGIKSVLLKVSNAFHSKLMEPMLEDFELISKAVEYNVPSKAILSNVTGGIIGKEIASWKYWSMHILSEVKFYQSIQSIENPENYIFLEIGPKPVLTSFVDNIYEEKAEILATNYPDVKTEEQIQKALFDLYVFGSDIEWRKYYSRSNFDRVIVPSYKFSEKHFEINKVLLKSDKYDKVNSNLSILKEKYENEEYEIKEVTFKFADNKCLFNTIDEAKIYIRSELKRELKIEENELADDENLLLYGLNSIVTTRLAAVWRKSLKISLKPRTLLENCSVNKWAEIIFEKAGKSDVIDEEKNTFTSHPEKRYESFSLSKVQNAYLVGRNSELEYGGVGCYGAYEIEIEELNLEKFKNALALLIKRHDMLRCIISEDGTQKIEKEIELPLKIYHKNEIYDMEKHLKDLRKEISLQVIPLGKPMFDIRVTETNDNKWIVLFGIDFMIADALSVSILWKDMTSFYFDNELSNLEVTYKDYLNYELMSNNNSYEEDKKYWLNKIENFPNTPELPVNIKSGNSHGFSRRKEWIDNKTWGDFVTLAAENNLTPSSALFCLYSEILSAWGGGEDFAVMLTVFNRELVHSQINQVIGDFTQLALVEVHRRNKPAGENALDFQIQMQKDIEHSNYSAIDFIKELNKDSDSERIYPIVFTSALGIDEMNNRDEADIFVKNLESIASSTPQVWIDHQVFKEKEGIALSWDTLDSIFFPDIVESMFEQYVELVKRASKEKDFWKNTLVDLRTKNQKNIQERSNDTFSEIEDSLLHENIINRDLYCREETAIVCDNTKYSYSQLINRANKVSELLEREDVQKGDKIGLQMKKSFDQIAVIIGILQIGAVYVPMNYEQPVNRTSDIIKRAGISILFVDDVNELLMDKVKQFNSENFSELDGEWSKKEISPSDLAYIIYTSGSTGAPKGVCIQHEAAMNTINDVNNRFKVTSKDSTFGLSSISFDLSVYDIFGILSVGGTLVLPTEEERIDPKCWKLLIEEYGVSIWNTVPALMKIYTDYIESVGAYAKDYKIRQIILSGDWIPLNLPDKIKANLPKAKLTSMGGATEASIWSNYYDVLEVESQWSSIPYGYPLSNQHLYILDEFYRPCPNWVKGKLFIGGKGLSTGYLNEEKLTEETFIYNTCIGERIYNTGDYGRYMEDGVIEFLGRKDSQLKINGYRIEIGEIESAFRKCGDFKEVIILPIGVDMNKNKIAAFLKQDEIAVSEDKLKLMLKEYLPHYFIPERIILLDKLPITSNGKIDRKELLRIFERESQLICENNELKDIKNIKDNPVLQTVREILNIPELKAEDSFSNIGVSSLEIIRLANQLEIIYTERPLVSEMIKYKFISELLEFYRDKIQYTNHDNIINNKKETIKISNEIQIKERIDENYEIYHKKDNKLNADDYEKMKALEERYNNLGIKLWLESESLKFKAPKGIMTLELRDELKENKEKLIIYLKEIQNNKFPLTPIQLAYVLGRSKDYELGNVSAHYYSEYEYENLDINKFEQAINEVIEKHEMLRTIINEDGTQEVLISIPVYKIKYKQITDVKEFEDKRNELSQCVYKLGQWPMFNIQVSRFENEQYRIHFSIDCLIADGWSTLLFLNEIFKAYHGIKIEEPDISIREYIKRQDSWLQNKAYHDEASKFWQEQVNKLPPAPNIPLKNSYELIEKPHFSRKMFVLNNEESDIFNRKMKKYNFTASAVICTAYMKVLSHWSEQKDITLNLTLFNRLPLSKDIMKVIGDFTNVTLIPYFEKNRDSFVSEIEEIQNLLWKAIEYRTYNGLNLLRTLSKDTPGKAIMPVVFTSLLFGESIKNYDEVSNNMKEIHSISQTPQVSLDHQVYERNGSITFIWDYVDQAFEEEIIDKMFNDYTVFIKKLIAEDDWNKKFYI